MKLFEYMNRENMLKLEEPRRKFVAKMIVREVQKVAAQQKISEEEAYLLLSKGLYGGDRDSGEVSAFRH